MIIYRNPIEAWFWEGGILYIAAFIAIVFFIEWLQDQWNDWKRGRK